ncbi:hypothetical protein C9J12_07540 [Photobacterium frigidiphilum]|uniref:OmpA-like domain-containing protein n=1 Tax=Photobacterium frigidiphilum TaxID=264736 RepID=A0A2T3JLZ9_9GAMM|nr:OmpA family protein [Photobacterium frigidiphilum]PSU49960.1 hypothetical protein C9J12_07540 [Photobacterium frigidiphilum]
MIWRLICLLTPLALGGCTLWPPVEDNDPDPPVQVQLRQLEHHSFELQILATRGAKLCLPGQYQKLEYLYLKARDEAKAGFDKDAEITLLQYKTQQAVIQTQMDWLEYHTTCFDHSYSEVELKEKLLVFMALDNQFALNRVELLPDYQQALRYAATILKRQSHWHLQLTGHTDSLGTSDSNIQLGMKRASAVKRFLIEQGVKSNQIAVFSAGESMAMDDTHSRTQRLANRKVEAQVLVEHHAQSLHRVYSLKDWNAVRESL